MRMFKSYGLSYFHLAITSWPDSGSIQIAVKIVLFRLSRRREEA